MPIESIIFSIAVLIMSVVIHEVSHGYAAGFLGDPTAKLAGRLTLNPIKHLDPIGSIFLPALLAIVGGPVFGWAKPVPYNPYNLEAGKWGPAIVAVAGPASNILLALLFGLPLRFGLVSSYIPEATLLFQIIVFVNLILALFNLIPVPPLDGSKILFAALPYHLRQVEEFMIRYQLILLLALIFFISSTSEETIVPLVQSLFTLITGVGF